MAVDNPDVVDAVGTSKANGDVILTIVDHLPWDDGNEHLLTLQKKINSYLEFIQNGQLADEYPTAKPGVDVEISVVFIHSPTDEAVQFLERARETIETGGWKFSWTHHPFDC